MSDRDVLGVLRIPLKGEQFIRGPVPDGPSQARVAWAGADPRCETARITEVRPRDPIPPPEEGAPAIVDASRIDVAFVTYRGAAHSDPLYGGEQGTTAERFLLSGWSRP